MSAGPSPSLLRGTCAALSAPPLPPWSPCGACGLRRPPVGRWPLTSGPCPPPLPGLGSWVQETKASVCQAAAPAAWTVPGPLPAPVPAPPCGAAGGPVSARYGQPPSPPFAGAPTPLGRPAAPPPGGGAWPGPLRRSVPDRRRTDPCPPPAGAGAAGRRPVTAGPARLGRRASPPAPPQSWVGGRSARLPPGRPSGKTARSASRGAELAPFPGPPAASPPAGGRDGPAGCG